MSIQDSAKLIVSSARPQKGKSILRAIVAQALGVGIVVVAGWNFWPKVIAWVATNGLRPHSPDIGHLLQLPAHILLHIGAATLSLVLGAIVLLGPKGTRANKLMGRVWMLAMVTTAVSSFFMESFAPLLGQFGPIHILSVVTLINMPRAVMLARKGDIAGHMQAITGTYIGLVIAGVMTFIPGRVMFGMFFG